MRPGRFGCVALLWSLFGCTQPRDALPSSLPVSPVVIELRGNAPSARIEQRSLGLSPRQLRLKLASIDNPEGVAFSVLVRVAWSGDQGASVANLGLVTPYPSDQTGAYAIAVPSELTDVLSAHDFALLVSIEPKPTSHLAVRIELPTWL